MSNSYDFDLDMESKNSLSVILSKIERGSVVLEFGCAHGRMSRYLQESLECRVYGVEIDAVAAETSRPFMQKMIVGDIAELEWLEAFKELRFDAIVFADVLEHLLDPLMVLSHAKELLKEDGSIFVSVPNVTHNSLVMELFCEAFTYRDAGLLDSTHLRFFSYESFRALAEKSGLCVVFEDGISVVPEMSEFSHKYEDLSPCVGDFLQSREYGEIYQFVFELKRDACASVKSSITRVASPCYAQVMIDMGDGYGEHIETLYVEREGANVCLEFALDRYEKILGIRFDPLNRCGIVRLEDISLSLESGESFSLKHSVSNAVYVDDGREYFSSYDPIYHLDLGDKEIVGAKHLKIVMSYEVLQYEKIVGDVIKIQDEKLREYRKVFGESIIMKFVNFIQKIKGKEVC